MVHGISIVQAQLSLRIVTYNFNFPSMSLGI